MMKGFFHAIALFIIPHLATASAVSGKATGPPHEMSLSMMSLPMMSMGAIFAKSGKGDKSGESYGGESASLPIMPKSTKAKVFKSTDLIMTDSQESLSMFAHAVDAKADKTMFGKSTGKSTKGGPRPTEVDAKAQKVSIATEAKSAKMAKKVIGKTQPFAI
ncbi:hypothetical protein ACHAXA_002687 [Cyclostephanos tholiformis]|uniref:Uncharacterized protein n=1 Tax=Cyclostephanos tholiformis TaxID=382380 RepID=A0ABD3S035_9STRA